MPNTTYEALSNRMNFLVARQSVIAGNIANANTPGYLAKDLKMDKPGSTGGSFAMAMNRLARPWEALRLPSALAGNRSVSEGARPTTKGDSSWQLLLRSDTRTRELPCRRSRRFIAWRGS